MQPAPGPFSATPSRMLGAGWRWRRNAGSPVPAELPLHGVGPAPVRPPAAPPLPRRPPGVALWRGRAGLTKEAQNGGRAGLGAHLDLTVNPLDELRCQKFLAHSIGRILPSKFTIAGLQTEAKQKFY